MTMVDLTAFAQALHLYLGWVREADRNPLWLLWRDKRPFTEIEIFPTGWGKVHVRIHDHWLTLAWSTPKEGT
jgi:hypothetical protein